MAFDVTAGDRTYSKLGLNLAFERLRKKPEANYVINNRPT